MLILSVFAVLLNTLSLLEAALDKKHFALDLSDKIKRIIWEPRPQGPPRENGDEVEIIRETKTREWLRRVALL